MTNKTTMTETAERTRVAARADKLGAFICVSEQSTATGREEPRAVTDSESLAGVPFAVKDNVDTVDLPTTAGTPALAESRPERNHPAVQRLLNAGAVMIGKTNMYELAFGITSNNGWAGLVRNPRDPSRSAGGSSAGSAVAVATDVVPFALATDTGGSATIPAAWCGVVGYRPTTGRYGAGHMVPLSATRDTVGLIARDVATVQCVDRVLVPDAEPVTEVAPIRLGLPSAGYLDPLAADVNVAWQATLEKLRAHGVERVAADTSGVHALEAECGFDIVFYEAVRDLKRYLNELPKGAPSLPELMEQIASPDVAELMQVAVNNPPTDDQYQHCLDVREHLRMRLDEVFSSAAVDALIYPTSPITATPVGDDTLTAAFGRQVPVFPTVTRNTGPGSVAGFPVITLPSPDAPELPVGISFEAPEGNDAQLLALAARIEHILR